MKKYTHLFFDLDHTLWDADANAALALGDLYQQFNLHALGVTSLSEFIQTYHVINASFWEQYATGTISKQALRYQRFLKTLQHFNLKDYSLSYELSRLYTKIAPEKPLLQPKAYELLTYLKPKYTLYIITNGFEDAQFIKLKSSQIAHFFTHVITPELAGSKKPNKAIFDYSLQLAKANCKEALMIGDNLQIDILGARAANIDQVYLNLHKTTHLETITFEIKSLIELKDIL